MGSDFADAANAICRRKEIGDEADGMQKPQWYALRVRPRFERIAALHLQSRNIEHYLPLCRVTRRLMSASQSLELPLLPGYVFCKAEARMRCSLFTIPGVLQIAAKVSDQKISHLKRITQTGLDVRQFMATGKTIS